MRFIALFVSALLLASCTATPQYTEGIPHLLAVPGVANLWRSGQPPADPQALRYVAAHFDRVVKLDTYAEGSADSQLAGLGVAVDYLPIPPSTRPGSPEDYLDILVGPSPEEWAQLMALAREVRAHPETRWLVHCVNGNDRTGAFVGLVLALGCEDPRDVYRYMVSTGFHWQLAGLADGWWRTVGQLAGECER